MTGAIRDPERIREQVEILSGERRGVAKTRAAIRVDDLAALLTLVPKLRSTKISTTPTADEFNALVADLADIHGRLNALREVLQARST